MASSLSFTTTVLRKTPYTSSSPAFTQSHFRPRRLSFRLVWSVPPAFRRPPATTSLTCFPATVFPPEQKSSSPTATRISRSRDSLILNQATVWGPPLLPSYKCRSQPCKFSPRRHLQPPLLPTSTPCTTTSPYMTTVHLRLTPPRPLATKSWNA